MRTEIKIIKYLIKTGKSLTIRELSKELGIDYKITHTAVSRLINKGILKSERIGSSIRVKFIFKFSVEVFKAEFERREEILKNKNFKVLLDSIMENIGTVNFILLVFGSYAINKQNKKSDIDLMFIVHEEKFEKKIEEITSVLPLKIHFLAFTEKQFREMKDSKELNVVKEAIKNNIILYGIEQYYELLK